MNRIGIVGAGTMGTDIAHLAAESGINVLLYDSDESQLKNSYEKIQNRLKKYLKKDRIKQNDIGEISSRIKMYNDINNIANANFIIECIPEDLDLKKEIFTKLDKICRPGTILATNTSSISITEIASATTRPESVVGIHFLIPARIMEIVELIPGLSTSRETIEITKDMLKQMKKITIEAPDFPGFMLNRLVLPLVNEAAFLVYEKRAKPEAIDKLMTMGTGIPMGPLALADMIGLDIVLAVAEQMYHGYSDSKYRPCPLFKQYVAAGYLGKKSGRGFYRY